MYVMFHAGHPVTSASGAVDLCFRTTARGKASCLAFRKTVWRVFWNCHQVTTMLSDPFALKKRTREPLDHVRNVYHFCMTVTSIKSIIKFYSVLIEGEQCSDNGPAGPTGLVLNTTSKNLLLFYLKISWPIHFGCDTVKLNLEILLRAISGGVHYGWSHGPYGPNRNITKLNKKTEE